MTETTQASPLPQVNKAKVEQSSKELFAVLLQNELSEAEAVAALTMTLAIRCAYASRDLEDLTRKIDRAQELFGHYARANLSSAMSVILAKQEDIQRSH